MGRPTRPARRGRTPADGAGALRRRQSAAGLCASRLPAQPARPRAHRRVADGRGRAGRRRRIDRHRRRSGGNRRIAGQSGDAGHGDSAGCDAAGRGSRCRRRCGRRNRGRDRRCGARCGGADRCRVRADRRGDRSRCRGDSRADAAWARGQWGSVAELAPRRRRRGVRFRCGDGRAARGAAACVGRGAGAARSPGNVGCRGGRADGVAVHPDAASRAKRSRAAAAPRRDARARDRARCGRRVRRQGVALSGGRRRRLGGDAARPSGQMDRVAQRGPAGDGAWPRRRDGGRAGRRGRRPRAGPARPRVLSARPVPDLQRGGAGLECRAHPAGAVPRRRRRHRASAASSPTPPRSASTAAPAGPRPPC